MVEQNTILFLFNQNDKKPNVNDKLVTFTFGEMPKKCEYPILIDKDKNLFEMGCNCHYIDYDTNIINIDCTIPDDGGEGENPTDPSCIEWHESEIGNVSFDCPCIPYEPQEPNKPTVDFVIDCSTGEEPGGGGEESGTPCIQWKEAPEGETPFACGCKAWSDTEDFVLSCKVKDPGGEEPGTGTGTPVLLGISRSNYGFTSNITFAIDISGVNNYFGYTTTFALSVANMRVETIAYAGFTSSFNLARTHTIVMSYSVGYTSASTIVYDPYHKFFTNDGDSSTAHFGNYASSLILYNPYHKFSEVDLTFIYGTDSKTTVLYDPFNKFSEVDLPIPYGFESKSTILYNPYHKFSEDNLIFSYGVDSKSTIVYNPYHKFSEDNLIFSYGIDSQTFILFNQYNKLSNDDINISVGFESKSFVLFDQYNKLSNNDINIQFGYDATSVIVYNPYHKLSNADIISYYGVNATSFILFDQYNSLSDKPLNMYSGLSSDTFILFNQYHPFTDEDIVAGFGFAPESFIVYDPYHEFFENKLDYASTSFGFNIPTYIVYNPYNEFFKSGETTQSYFGTEFKGNIIFNPYNQFNEGVINPFVIGYDTKSSIRYNDDHRITPNDINLSVGIDSQSGMKLANIYANVSTTFPYGFESTSQYQYHPGFVSTSYVGYATNIKYLTYKVPYPTFGICISGMGFELHNNHMKPRYFDLSKNECCSIKPYELLHIEMAEFEDWDVLYGNENGWGIACIADLCAQPRMSASLPIGFHSDIIDNTVYLGQVEIGFGMHTRVRGLQFNTNIELGNGNFITDQNEIKVELTKPDDIFDINYVLGYGVAIHTNLGAVYGLKPNNNIAYGITSNITLRVDEALRGSFTAGYNSRFQLNNTSRFAPRSYAGFGSTTIFFEPPYTMYHSNAYMHCEGIITQNWVEFLEEGELNNDYLFQTKNGDIDETRPNGVSLEGYPFTRYIKGRCY